MTRDQLAQMKDQVISRRQVVEIEMKFGWLYAHLD
jgi:hypothetical protein